jgi:hypothetical protein
VKPQQPDRGALIDRDGDRYRQVRPDIVVYRDDIPVAVIDAKYKEYWKGSTPDRLPLRRIDNADLYQLFFYSQRLQLRYGLPRPPKAIIVSPLPAEDEREGTPVVADQFRQVVWRAGQESPSQLHLVLLPITDILRCIGPSAQRRIGDPIQHVLPLFEMLEIQ